VALPLAPPVAPMLAKLERELPRGDGWVYEPKWDGFRAIVFVSGGDAYIQSRDKKPLNRYFPELVPAFLETFPPECIVDGEVVVAGPQGLDFDLLQMRIHPAESRVKMLAAETPASFVAFDLLAVGERSLMESPLEARREELASLLSGRDGTGVPGPGSTQILLTPQTDSFEEADAWFERFEALGLDGVVAKKLDIRYRPGQRVMVKVKKVKTADCVVGAYRPSRADDGIGSLLLGLYRDGVLHFVGHTSSFSTAERKRLRGVLKEYEDLEAARSFGEGRTPGGPSRWARAEQEIWTPLRPELVCEVRYDKMQGDRFRHAATFLRWRDDKRPEECTFDQLA
jgi:ATP-dependent DNA ligase